VLLAALLLIGAPVARAQSGPDAAPGGSSGGPSPDPAPTVKRTPKPAATVRAPSPTTTTPATSAAAPTTQRRATQPKSRATKSAKRHTHRGSAVRTRSLTAALSLPRLSPAHLVAPASNGDEQARRLAIGGLSLLLLALASAMLLAFTLRTDRGRRLR
jgi:hypothetical protein